MLDLIVSGGVAVMPSGTAAVDIGVAGEKIVAIGAPGGLGSAGAARRIVDATGQIVIPGGVDPHIHCLSPIPFPGRNEDMLSAPHKSFAAIDRFLQLGSPRDRLERAIRRSSFKVLQEQEKRRGFREKTEVAERFFRAGKAGQWRTALSRAQIDRVVEAHRDQMARFGYLPA